MAVAETDDCLGAAHPVTVRCSGHAFGSQNALPQMLVARATKKPRPVTRITLHKGLLRSFCPMLQRPAAFGKRKRGIEPGHQGSGHVAFGDIRVHSGDVGRPLGCIPPFRNKVVHNHRFPVLPFRRPRAEPRKGSPRNAAGGGPDRTGSVRRNRGTPLESVGGDWT